uniref:Uncharacterized protein n=1 Tax=Oncorhynchus tshawytscha TaxID=74940 RepID=A0AAZ3PF49_ONCTS
MIATGGLLRMNRRQDSQRSKNHAENQRKRKQAERKKRNDVVVVKGKLNLCSPSGLVAAVGVVVLMLGIAMAVLGYWPHEGHSQGYASGVSPGEERRSNGRMSYSKSPLVSVTWSNNKDNNTANQTVGELTNQTVEELTNQTVGELTNQTVGELTNQTVEELTNQTVGELTNQTVEELTNQTSAELTNQMSDVMNGSVPQPLSVSTSPRPPSGGFLSEFLDSYLYSDNLKVFGPLVMGIGIFLFICANAVLHENRDQKTKVINLRDIYSTVIDHHSKRTKDYSPINGLVNYVQSRGSVDINSGSFHPGEMLEHSPWPSTTVSSHQGEIGSSEQQYRRPSMAGRQRSIYRDQKRRCSEQTPYPRQWDSEQDSYPRQRDTEQDSYPRQWDSEQDSYPRQWDSEQDSYPRQWDSEQASYPRQWDSEQASYPRQWDSEQDSYPRQWDSEQDSYPRQRDSEQASYPRQWDSEQASYPRQWDSEQDSYPRQWDSEQDSYPRQRDSEQASYPRQWEGTASIVSSSFNVFTLPIITLNN